MGEALALAGRFGIGLLTAALEELVATGPAGRYGGWGIAYCYGTLLEVVRSDRPAPGAEGGFDFSGLNDIKTDLAIARLTDKAEVPAYNRDLQPYLRREAPRPQAFCAPARLRNPRALDAGHRITDGADPDERFFLHVLHSFDEGDPLGSVTAMHERLAGEPDQRFMLLNTRLLAVSTWQEPGDGRPPLWLGRSDLVRALAPTRLEALGEMSWEPVAARSVMVFTRQRYEAGQPG
jgi:hypothetical protein